MTVVSSRKQRGVKVFGVGCLVLVVIALALPLWFPWVLRPALARFGIRFDSYARVGYTRFALTNVRRDAPNARFRCDRLSGFLPAQWLWRRFSPASPEEPFLTVAHWRVRIQTGEQPRPAKPSPLPNSAFAVAERISGALPMWRVWLPAAQLSDGRVEIGSNAVAVVRLDWRRGKVTGRVACSNPGETFAVQGDFSGAPPYAISLDEKSSGLSSRLRLSRATGQWQAAGDVQWRSNRLEVEAVFDRDGWWPRRAGLKSDHFHVPSKLVRLEGYDDPTGAFELKWVDGHFHLEGSARATPDAADRAFAPPLELSLLARGDTNSVVLEKLRITSPAIEADLSNPIGLDRSGKLTTETATLRMALDLGQLHGSSFGGKLNGRVRVRPLPAGPPTAEFDLSGRDLSGRGFSITQAHLGGRLSWPVLNLDGAEITLADGSTLGGAGEIALKSRVISHGKWHFQGPWVRRFLPPGLTFSNLQATGELSGPLSAPVHSGELQADDCSVPILKPCRVFLAWRGENLVFPDVQIRLAAETATLDLKGAVRVADPPARSCEIDLKTLTLTRAAGAVLRLERPCRIAARREVSTADRNQPSSWALKVNGFSWAGPDGGLTLDSDVTWPRRGKIDVSGHGLSSADLREFVTVSMAKTSLSGIDLKANWDGGPIEFKLSAEGELPALEDQTFRAKVKLSGNADGLVADPVIVSVQGTEIVRAQGKMPLTLTTEPGGLRIRLEDKKPFNFQAATEPNKPFWDFARQRLGVRIVDPKVEANLQGTLAQLTGTLRGQASQISRLSSTNEVKLPPLENLRLEARFEQDRVQLGEFTFDVENQPVRITGDIPIRQNFLLDFISHGALPDWRRARARIEIADARLEPFARYLPAVLSPQGRLSVSLGVVPGGGVNGELMISGAATRSFTPLAPIRDIQARVLFAARRATIGQFTGRMGGREVSASGHFELPESGAPQFELRLRGDNVPLVYRPGLLLRSDFDLQFAQAGGQPATVSGDVTLRDGLFLEDLKALAPTSRAEPLGRPPYFSVTEQPFADWKLNVRVQGERFLRVRTPFFRGVVSTDLQIRGDFQEPQALGEARINSGQIRFPFGTLNLDHGLASLTSEHPYEPQLLAAASSRLYGYNIKMEITGTASAPLVSFSSTPPLTSEQVLLMLAAGELPREELSFSREKRVGNFALYLGKDVIARWLGNEDSADRLTIRSGEDISQEGRTTYYLEYKLSDDWSVIGEYDRFNALNAGLKWRIFSR